MYTHIHTKTHECWCSVWCWIEWCFFQDSKQKQCQSTIYVYIHAFFHTLMFIIHWLIIIMTNDRLRTGYLPKSRSVEERRKQHQFQANTRKTKAKVCSAWALLTGHTISKHGKRVHQTLSKHFRNPVHDEVHQGYMLRSQWLKYEKHKDEALPALIRRLVYFCGLVSYALQETSA